MLTGDGEREGDRIGLGGGLASFLGGERLRECRGGDIGLRGGGERELRRCS